MTENTEAKRERTETDLQRIEDELTALRQQVGALVRHSLQDNRITTVSERRYREIIRRYEERFGRLAEPEDDPPAVHPQEAPWTPSKPCTPAETPDSPARDPGVEHEVLRLRQENARLKRDLDGILSSLKWRSVAWTGPFVRKLLGGASFPEAAEKASDLLGLRRPKK